MPMVCLQLHLGVNSGAMRFAIENQAVNEATFRCPDELGWKPQVLYFQLHCYIHLSTSNYVLVIYFAESFHR